MRSPIFSRDRVTVVGVLNATPIRSPTAAASSWAIGSTWTRSSKRRCGCSAPVRTCSTSAASRPGQAPWRCRRTSRSRASCDSRGALQGVRAAALDRHPQERRRARRARGGGGIVNDVSGGRFDPALLAIVAEQGAWLVLGHLRGTPATMQDAPQFHDVLGEVAEELAARVARAKPRASCPRRSSSTRALASASASKTISLCSRTQGGW